MGQVIWRYTTLCSLHPYFACTIDMWMAWPPNCPRIPNIFPNWHYDSPAGDTFGFPRPMKNSKKTTTLPMKVKKFISVLLLIPCFAIGQNHLVSGSVSTSPTNEPLPDATILIVGKTIGTTTDINGNFELNSPEDYPIKISVTYIGYSSQEIVVMDNRPIQVILQIQSEELDGIVVSASRVEESILESPVSIEKMGIMDIRRTPSANFYDGLQNLKGLDLVTSGLTYKEINTRGFNDTGNARFLQLVDGVDNQTPGLTFAVGNLFGSSDLDMESVELIPGSASALYGPVAFNGVLLMRTKDPFKYQGLSISTR